MNLQHALEDWMEEHEAEILDLLIEEGERFRAMHPGMSEQEERWNALMMANRRFLVRAIGEVLPRYLEQWRTEPEHG